MVDAVVSILLERVVARLVDEGSQLLELDDRFEEMKKELSVVQTFLKDAERVRRNEQNESLKMVIHTLRELVYDAEDLIADCQLFFLEQGSERLSCMSFFSPCFLVFRCKISKRLREIMQRIANVKEGMLKFLDTALNLPRREMEGGNLPVNYPFLIDTDEIVGLEDDSKKIRKWVTEASHPLTVIGIVGMGGLGKTTLAQKIYKDDLLNGSFEHVQMVNDCKSKNLEEILKKMLKKLQVSEETMRGAEVLELLEVVKSQLDKKKYLIILDNVWSINEEQWWERLRDVLPRTDGSCVIVTTRNEYVARSMGAVEGHIHRPPFLSKDDSWSLFSKVAFQRSRGLCTDEDLIDIGKEIVRKCNGLPLTIKVVAGMMHAKQHSISEWRRITDHLQEELATNNIDALVTSSLQLSYEDLPSYLKPCLLLFSLFSGYEIFWCQYIINIWIGEGLICGKNGKMTFEVGQECIVELLNRCLIQVKEMDIFEKEIYSFTIHDMVMDMVTKIAREENFVEFDDGGRLTITNMSRRGVMLEGTHMESLKTDSKLRTLVGFESTEAVLSVGRKSFPLKWLRVLDLSLRTGDNNKIPNKDLLGGIGSLPHLIYLGIEINQLEELPDSIGNLRELQVLYLHGCFNLKRLPPQVTTLEKLTHLNMNGCDSLEYIPKGIGKLSNLQQLCNFMPTISRHKDEGCRVADLKNLAQLRRLVILIKSEDQIEEGELNALSNLPQLKYLSIQFTGTGESNDFLRKVDRLLSPLQNLQVLRLVDFPGEIMPTWINPTTLPNLRFLVIDVANLRQVSVEFWGSEDAIWKLEGVVLSNGSNGAELFPKMQKAMPHLRSFKVFKDTTWKDLSLTWKKEGGDDGAIETTQ